MIEKISNNKSNAIIIAEMKYETTGRIERYISIVDDWYNVKQFEFENKEQIQEVIDALIKVKERWS